MATPALAIPFTFDARSLGMAGVSVVTAQPSAAPWANPAMLARYDLGDEFTLLVGFGLFARDDDDLLGDIDDFQDADDRRREAREAGDKAEEAAALLDMRLIVREVESKVIAPEATLLLSSAAAMEHFDIAFSFRSDIIAGGTMTDLSCELTEPGCDPGELLSEEYNILNIEGVKANEYGVSFAWDLDWEGRRVTLGVKPKLVDLYAFSFRESILTVDAGLENLEDDDDERSLGVYASVDLGFTVELHENWLAGLSLRNLIPGDFDLAGQTLDFDTEAEIGVAYHSGRLLVGIDFDIFDNEPTLANNSFDGLRTQSLSLGAEYRLTDRVFLRAGAEKNVASGISDGAKEIQYTVGMGFRVGFDLDLAAIIAENSLGAIVQGEFRF